LVKSQLELEYFGKNKWDYFILVNSVFQKDHVLLVYLVQDIKW
jgi:hypothetical protein